MSGSFLPLCCREVSVRGLLLDSRTSCSCLNQAEMEIYLPAVPAVSGQTMHPNAREASPRNQCMGSAGQPPMALNRLALHGGEGPSEVRLQPARLYPVKGLRLQGECVVRPVVGVPAAAGATVPVLEPDLHGGGPDGRDDGDGRASARIVAGGGDAMLARRHQIYQRAKARHPERWSRDTRDWTPAGPVRLNPTPNLTSAPLEVRCTG